MFTKYVRQNRRFSDPPPRHTNFGTSQTFNIWRTLHPNVTQNFVTVIVQNWLNCQKFSNLAGTLHPTVTQFDQTSRFLALFQTPPPLVTYFVNVPLNEMNFFENYTLQLLTWHQSCTFFLKVEVHFGSPIYRFINGELDQEWWIVVTWKWV